MHLLLCDTIDVTNIHTTPMMMTLGTRNNDKINKIQDQHQQNGHGDDASNDENSSFVLVFFSTIFDTTDTTSTSIPTCFLFLFNISIIIVAVVEIATIIIIVVTFGVVVVVVAVVVVIVTFASKRVH
mmetsp:Transcript_40015/g.44797  ORF Transcript_40015/g.44797 Transcript_40015/m.44797 type:complete len:127 (-) Transcript_40015:10-390(-)